MGTPEFAVPSLDALFRSEHEVVAVVTVPDKPAGRGRKLTPSPVKTYAVEHNIPVLQPVKLRDPEFIEALQNFHPDVMVVVAFRMLPKMVWEIPSQGTFNLHSSLLPDYRGAAPINWAVINGETKSGVTTFLIDDKIDTGNLLLQTEVDVPLEWTAGDLHDHLMEIGAELVLKTVNGLADNALTPMPQDHNKAIHKAPKIFKEDCIIDWNQPVEQAYNFIRGLSPYPTAWTTLDEKPLKLFQTRMVEADTLSTPGAVISDEQSIKVACKDGWLEILELQIAGKKRMRTEDFLRGFKEEMTEFK
ncbi:MAG: methionyl-tRNA formyltransferase [Bacteroidetes bacterium]|nr:methionyl-tRNA formyltransferase [Bacteroidota bacterium]